MMATGTTTTTHVRNQPHPEKPAATMKSTTRWCTGNEAAMTNTTMTTTMTQAGNV